jgi:hypothetical protein
MLFKRPDYIRFYWTVYFYVRAKYFPGDDWIGKFKNMSPDMWKYDTTGKKDSLGRVLFGRVTLYIYLNTTYYNERKVDEIDIDNEFLIKAFNEIGCVIEDEQRKAEGLNIHTLPHKQLQVFLSRYNSYLRQHPDIDVAVTAEYEKLNKKLNVDIGQQSVDGKKEHEVSKEEWKYFKNEVSQKHIDHITEFFNEYFALLNLGDFMTAFDYWHPVTRKIRWNNNLGLFDREYNSGFYISDVNVFNIALKDTSSVNHRTCKVSYSEEIDISSKDLLNHLFQTETSQTATIISEIQHFICDFDQKHFYSLKAIMELHGDRELCREQLAEILPNQVKYRVNRLFECAYDIRPDTRAYIKNIFENRHLFL